MEEYYSESGEFVDSVELAPGGSVVGLNIPIGQWHTVPCPGEWWKTLSKVTLSWFS